MIEEKTKQHILDMRTRSGNIDFNCKLTSFLYTLMRDHITPGTIEQILIDDLIAQDGDVDQYTNGWLACYANDLASRLNTKKEATVCAQ